MSKLPNSRIADQNLNYGLETPKLTAMLTRPQAISMKRLTV